jgi:hypothetical protein
MPKGGPVFLTFDHLNWQIVLFYGRLLEMQIMQRQIA